MNGEPKFLTDASLGGLAKWLRILGFNAAVYHPKTGGDMMRLALETGRILLTRRADLQNRPFSGRIVLVPSEETSKQLAFVVESLSLKIMPEKFFTVCLLCNEILLPVSREDVKHLVPQYIYETCLSFHKCRTCGKIFWSGTHLRNMMTFLKIHGLFGMA